LFPSSKVRARIRVQPTVTSRLLPLMGFERLPESHTHRCQGPYRLGPPSMPFYLRLRGPHSDRALGLIRPLVEFRESSRRLICPFRDKPRTELPSHRAPEDALPCFGAFLEVWFPFSVFPTRGSGFMGRRFLVRPPASSGFRNLLTPSSAPSLPALFHTGPAPGVHPSEHCSSGAGERRLRRRYPLGVRRTR